LAKQIDESRRHNEPAGIDSSLRCTADESTDGNDSPARGRDVGGKERRARAVGNTSVLEDEIIGH
jgi:hypothetical protein